MSTAQERLRAAWVESMILPRDADAFIEEVRMEAREEVYKKLVDRLSRARYRLMVFDGMDTIRTAVIPVPTVEHAIGEVWGRKVRLDVRPAGSDEGPREDAP